jgi:hypothetical protein
VNCGVYLSISLQRVVTDNIAVRVSATLETWLPYLYRCSRRQREFNTFNPLTPNDNYSGRTAPLTSKRCILYIYSTNLGTEYFKHGIYSPLFLFKMQFVS